MKYILLCLGIFSLILGIIGIFLPLLPTTPFLLLSAFLFARSSERLYAWLLNHKVLGEYIKGFLLEKAIPLRIKIYSIAVLWLAMICTGLFVFNGKLYLQILQTAVAVGVTIHILSYKTKKQHRINTEQNDIFNADNIRITEYNPLYKNDFVRLNKEWIIRYFEMEDEDYRLFSNPEKIITDGGNIFFALHGDKAVGTVALIREDDGRKYEISKMAVSPEYRGRGIGEKLLKYAIEYAADHHVKYLYLISNTRLTPAIKLYEKSGFKQINNGECVYKRGDYTAELRIL